ncbi:hypothetical protein Mal52_40010 [Symmachiella dynata]|uniref:Uncharacterized protein n=1 Tax=Symmachiella dynata TaxID=2527995 RepID=A0A517ZSP3_9PLAN|nr:hypothetical protein Mal52_40010 [Symmachiella dynata]
MDEEANSQNYDAGVPENCDETKNIVVVAVAA